MKGLLLMVQEHNISWVNLLRTVDHFKSLGYTYVEVPWTVSCEAMQATFVGKNPLSQVFQNRYVVASGEQSFIQLEIEGKLPIGKYVTLTPCYRDEPNVSDTHKLSFMKVELYITDIKDSSVYSDMVGECADWFFSLQDHDVTLISTDIGHDFNIGDIEIGSYGEREYNGKKWLYGTAIAEPRFSTAVRNFGK
jgi:hypothetical protein